MEFRLLVNGQPVTDWEQIRARDVGLWKDSTRITLGLGDRDVIEAQSRKVGAPEVPVADMSKAQLRDQAELLGIDVPSGATKSQIVDLIESS